MNPGQVHAVLVAAVENPALVEQWMQNPKRLQDYGVNPESLDLSALWKFSGLAIKVKHNGLRQDLPMTFRLMNVAGLEIDLFAAYASHCASQGRRLAPTSAERADDLILFLEHWLEPGRLEHVCLWDMIRHERSIARLNAWDEFQSDTGESWQSAAPDTIRSGKAVPCIQGGVILQEMHCNPELLSAELRRQTPSLKSVPLEAGFYCYWRKSEKSDLQFIGLDAFGYYALSLMDGGQTVGDISIRMGGKRRPQRGFLSSLTELSSIGIFDFYDGGS